VRVAHGQGRKTVTVLSDPMAAARRNLATRSRSPVPLPGWASETVDPMRGKERFLLRPGGFGE
jgi:hypothetical protein